MLLHALEDAATDRVHLRFPDSSEHTTGAELWSAAGTAAGALGRFTEPEEAVGIVLHSNPPSIAALLGGFRAGLRMVSLPRRLPGQTLVEYLADIEHIRMLAGFRHLVASDPELAASDGPLGFAIHDALALTQADAPNGDRDSGAFVQCTSGTTAVPKGVRLTLDALATNVDALLQVIAPVPGDITFSALPLSHDMGLIGMCLASIVGLGPRWADGGTVVLSDPARFAMKPGAWLESCSRHRATITALPPRLLRLLNRWLEHERDLELDALRICIVGSDMIDAGVLTEFERRAGTQGLHPEAISPAYGLAEASLGLTFVPPSDHWRAVDVTLDQSEHPQRFVSVGPPLPGVTVETTAPTNTVDELRALTGGRCRGYLGEPDEAGWLATGDLGVIEESGEVAVLGRIDDFVELGNGRRLHAPTLEDRICRDESVRAAGCAIVTSEQAGEYSVVVELRGGKRVSRAPEDVAASVAAIVEVETGQAPTDVVVTPRRGLPVSYGGKLQRAVTRDLLLGGELPVAARTPVRSVKE